MPPRSDPAKSHDFRPIALNRNNALFVGSDEGGTVWGVLASLVETCKLNGVEPHAYFTDVLTKIVQGWPAARLDDLVAVGIRVTEPPLTKERKGHGAAAALEKEAGGGGPMAGLAEHAA